MTSRRAPARGEPLAVRLVACANCHTQYDVSGVVAKSFPCRCGETLENSPPEPVDAAIRRCGACGALVTDEAESCTYCGSTIIRERGNLSLICPECYGRNAEDSRFCTACGVRFRPEEVRVEGHELPCPSCTVLMPACQVGGIGVNECSECNGLWVPDESFDLLVSRAIDARQSADPVKLMGLAPRVTGSNPAAQRVLYRKCPECESYMQRRNFRKSSGVIIDCCVRHGTWLDADELEQIAGFILSGGTTSPLLRQDSRSNLDARAQAELARLRVGSHGRGRAGVEKADSFVELLSGLLGKLV